MKKFVIFLTVCLMAAGCGSVRIAMNSKNEKGERIVLTSDERLFGNISAALGAKVAGRDTVLAVLVTYDGHSDHGVFDKDDRMLIRLSDQSVITLLNTYHKEFEESTSTDVSNQRVSEIGYTYTYDPLFGNVYLTPYEVSRFVPKVTTTHTTLSYALYFISKPDLARIIDKGVIKLRVEIEDRELDMPNTSSVSEKFKEMRTCLYDCVKAGVTRTEF